MTPPSLKSAVLNLRLAKAKSQTLWSAYVKACHDRDEATTRSLDTARGLAVSDLEIARKALETAVLDLTDDEAEGL
jgi:hypothetical protein